MDAELVNDILPIGINLPKNQKNLLAILIYINGIDEKDNEGYFYVDNQYLMNVLEVSEPTLIANANKLISKGFIIRKSGKKHHPSKYLITDYTKDFSKTNTKDFSKTNTKDFSKTVEDFSQDKEQDKDIDKEKEIDKDKINKYINNIIEKEIFEKIDSRLELKFSEMMRMFEDKLNLIQDALTKTFSTSIETSTNTEKTNTAMNTNELTKIEELQIENAKLKERLDNCAKQFKKMMQTIDELQQKVSELEAKQNNTSTNQDSSTKNEIEDKTEANQDSSTSSKSASTIETSTKQEISDSKPSNESALPTTHKEEENSSEASKTASNQIVEGKATPKEEEKQTEGQKNDSTEVVEDVDVDEVMKDFADAVKQFEEQNGRCNESVLNTAKAFYLQDLDEKNASYRVRKEVENRINNYIKEYNEKTSRIEENTSSGTTTHQDEEKPTDSVSKASTAISEDNAATSNDVDDLFDGIIISGKASKKDELKHSNEGADCTPAQSEDTKEVKDLKMPKTVEGCFQRYLESVEEQKKLGLNNTRNDLLYQKDCIIKSCKMEGFEEDFIQEVEAKIDEHINEYSEKSDSKPSNGLSLPTTNQEEEKPTEAQQMPLNEKKLRYIDRKTQKQYATEAEAQSDGADPMFLYDTKVRRCIISYSSHTSPSNEGSGIVANQDDLKPVESQKMPSTSMSYSYAAAY